MQAKRGGLKDTPADDLLAAVLKGVISQTGIDPAVTPHLCVFAHDLHHVPVPVPGHADSPKGALLS